MFQNNNLIEKKTNCKCEELDTIDISCYIFLQIILQNIQFI